MYAQTQSISGEQKCLPLSLSPLKKRVTVVKEKGSPTKAICENEMFPTKRQTQICIFKPHIYSFLFQHFIKSLRKYPKALKIQPFVLFRAKSWFRINGREKISGLTLPTFCRLAHNVSARPLFKSSFWGLEAQARPHFEVLMAKLKYCASVIKEKPRRTCRKSMGHYDPLIFTPLPFVRNSIYKEFLEKSRKIW